jgi:alpha-tubulin suppressor-like RCC1 family protein
MRTCLALLSLALVACGPADGGGDAGLPSCVADTDCDDGLHCNGVERCAPDAPGASRLGCVAGAPSCLAGQSCDEATDACMTVCAVTEDADEDGARARECGGEDCDDADADRFPGNAEICDDAERDEDCDATTFGARDLDDDGHEDDACCNVIGTTRACGDDCDDTASAIHPGASEVCNGVDDDCDGLLDGPGEDSDRDGRANSLCAGAGGSDCNDRFPDIYDGALELCDGIDSDCTSCDLDTQRCSGPNCASPDTRCGDVGSDTSEDADGDSHAPVGASCSGGFPADDCDDTSAAAYPGLPETCDGHDNDCDGDVDEDGAVLPACAAPGGTMGCDSAGGTCTVLRCDAGLADCDADPSTGCETELATDVEHCGACGVSCGPGGVCTDGLCDAVIQLDTRDATTCAVRAGGAALCWGRNAYGGVGDRTLDTRTAPVLVTEVAAARSVVTSGNGTCAIQLDGQVACWGVLSGTPSPAVEATELAADGFFACALEPGGTVACWGQNFAGQLGDGTRDDAVTAVRVAGVNDAQHIAVADGFGCAVLGDGSVVCWGDGWGSLTPVPLSGAPAAIEQIAAQGDNVCVRASGAVTCWGSDDSGQRGDGAAENPFDVPSIAYAGDFDEDAAAIDVAVGGDHVCVIDAGRRTWCWGANDEGQLGDGTTTSRDARVITRPPRPAAIRAGSRHTCVLTETGSIVCWGANQNGQFGVGDLEARATPGPRAGVGTPTVTQGSRRSAVRLPDGILATPGFETRFVAIGDGFVAVDAQVYFGEAHACGIRSDGTGWCWGSNSAGQLGDASAEPETELPVQFGSFTDLVQISVGNRITCALRANGEIVCVGENFDGRLGDGTTISRTTIEPVLGIDDAVEIGTGWYHSCARRANGDLVCWGNNDLGMLGDGTTDPSLTPQVVPGISHVAQLSVGNLHTCVRRTSGGVLCWGRGGAGQIGDGFTMDRYSPTEVVGLPSDVIGISGRGLSHCAWTRSGGVWCWGANDQGQVGDGTTANRPTPVRIAIDDAVLVSTGGRSVFAVRASGSVLAWGQNGGALGIGRTTVATTPTYVIGP